MRDGIRARRSNRRANANHPDRDFDVIFEMIQRGRVCKIFRQYRATGAASAQPSIPRRADDDEVTLSD
jgi:hypothetical protein